LFYGLLSLLPLGDEAWLRVPALVPAIASVPVLYCLVRPLLGTRVALLSALALAVAPFHVSYSNYSRGFMLAALGLLLAAWAVARLAEGRRGRWWWLYLGGATLALHSEYDAALFLAPLLPLPALWRQRGWKEVVALGALPLATLLPLIGEMLRGLDQIDVTKLAPPTPGLSAASLRDSVVSLFSGTNGLADAAGVRALQLSVIVAGLAGSAVLLWRDRRDIAFSLLVFVPTAGLTLHVLASAAGSDVFDARYLTPLIPFVVALLAYGVTALPWHWTAPAAAVGLVVLGIAVFAQRFDRELQPDYGPVAASVEASRARTVLTNTPVATYYLRDRDARLDRPFGLGSAEADCAARCLRPLAVVEDGRLPGGLRAGPGRTTAFGPIVVRIRR
jgi:hypothetical protein